MQTYHNKCNLNIIKNTTVSKTFVSLKDNVTKICSFYNETSIHSSHVSTIPIIQRNYGVIKKRNHLNK